MAESRRPPLLHIASLVFGTPLAILPDKLDVILRALGPRLVVDPASIQEILDSGALRRLESADYRADWDDDDYAPSGSSSSKKPYQITDQGVALIPVRGILLKKGGWMSALSGCSSYEGIGKSVSTAVSDPQVKALLLDIDSPGGTTHGCFELSDQIYNSRSKSKPIYAVANDLAASAAYALASSADRIFLTRTAGVGSIGVFCLHASESALDDKIGVKYTYIFAGERKVDGNPHEPLSKTARATIQVEVDRQYSMFVSAVSRNRGVSKQDIIDTKADVYSADRAISLLADEEGTFADALAALTNKVTKSNVMISLSSETTGEEDMTAEKRTIDIAALKAKALAAQKEVEAAEAALAAAPAGIAAAIDPLAEPKRGYTPRRTVTTVTTITSHRRPLSATDKMEPDEDDDDVACDNPDHPEGCDHGEDYDSKKKAKLAKEANLPTQPTPAAPAPPAQPAQTLQTLPGAANDAAVEIAELCAIGGHPELVVKFLSERKTVAEARKTLAELRAAESSRTSVSASVGASVSVDALSSIEQQSDALVASSGGKLTKSAAMMQVLKRNPKLYQKYNQERLTAAMTPEGAESYVLLARQHMTSLGLSAETTGF